MAREEPVATASVAVDDVNHVHELWILRRAVAGYEGFEDTRGHLIGDQDAEGNAQYDTDHRPEVIVANDHVEQ